MARVPVRVWMKVKFDRRVNWRGVKSSAPVTSGLLSASIMVSPLTPSDCGR
jgi:hypothetical protein